MKKSNEMSEKEKENLYKKIQMRMTTAPVPDDLTPPEIMPFLIIFETPEVMSVRYILEKLHPHWKDVVAKASVSLQHLRAELDKLDNIFEEYTSQQKKKDKSDLLIKIDYMNVEIYRRYSVIQPLWVSVKNNLMATRRAIIIQRIEILQGLFNLCTYLLEYPRYIAVKSYSAFQDWKSLESDIMPVQYLKFHSLKFALSDLQYQNQCLPRPFSSKNQNISLISHMITNGIVMIDPQSGYIPVLDEYFVFSYFLESKVSPFVVEHEIPKNMEISDIPALVTRMVAALSSYINLDSTNSQYQVMKQVLYQMCARYVFDRQLIVDKGATYSKVFESNLAKSEKMTLQQLGYATTYIPKEFIDKTAEDIVSSNNYLSKARDLFLSILFQTYPGDIASILYQVSLCLSGCVAEWTGQSFDFSSSFDDMILMWKLIFLSSQCSSIAWIISSLERYENMEVISALHANTCLVPRALIMNMSQ